MTHASCKTIINTLADAIWQALSDFGAACQYLAVVVNCTVEGTGVGVWRTLTYADGSMIVERFHAVDEAAHGLSYALLTDTPFRDCLTTVTVSDLHRGQCEVAWWATFEADGLPAEEARELLGDALAANCLA